MTQQKETWIFSLSQRRFSPPAPGLEEEVLDPHELMGSFLWSPGQGESLWIAV
jgi:hypothetical protein